MNLTIACVPACWRRLLWLSFSATVKVQREGETEISTCFTQEGTYGKTGNKKHATSFANMLPNELNSVIAHFNFITTQGRI